MQQNRTIIPYSPYPPRILPVVTVQQERIISCFGDKGTKIPLRPHVNVALWGIGVCRVGVYISSLTPYITKKKKERRDKVFILLCFFFGQCWGGSKNNRPRIIPIVCSIILTV